MTPVSSHDAARPALTTRALDFWLLGGASVVVWASISALEPLRDTSWAVDHHFRNLAAASATLALVCNYPHFMASYKLAYAQGAGFLRSYWFQLGLVPVLLVAGFAWSYLIFEDDASAHTALRAVATGTGWLGLTTGIGSTQNAGRESLGLLINFMYFTVGWHYSKQAYGCMSVYARYDGYPLDARQRQVMKAAVFSIWAVSYTWANRDGELRDYFGVPYLGLGLPEWMPAVAMVFFAITLAAFAYAVVFKNYEAHGVRPGLTFLVPYVSFILWWLPPLMQRDFYFLLVPFFHGLQYLPFVYRVEHERLSAHHPATAVRRGTLTALALIGTGFLAFELVPNTLDAATGTRDLWNTWFFFVSANVFINIHHYFIDNALWRFKNRAIQEYLVPSG